MLSIFKRNDKCVEKFFEAYGDFLKSNKESQQKRIIRYLTHKSDGLTSFDAFEKLHVTKLSTRISELKEQGYEFIQVWETNSDGTARFYRYFLKNKKGIKCPE